MAKKSVIARAKRKPKFSTRKVNRCFRCGRNRGYIGDFDLCRICFREMVLRGELPGVRRASL
ncbi:type Z 30S ribosomal protein S14 [Candidatus Azambacteria bacterium]|nr:type Z 30S ribosomal protein S14 [Candidatus Azambacteria bacterium]MBI3685267.1 type Z 30S ribosomal protein S14 [Candidatus Azambacteria bacterium]